jgi:hypothetical protein
MGKHGLTTFPCGKVWLRKRGDMKAKNMVNSKMEPVFRLFLNL